MWRKFRIAVTCSRSAQDGWKASRLLQTDDDYIEGQTGWRIYALALPDAVLEAIYRGTARRVLNWK